jgi:hypothetical protein
LVRVREGVGVRFILNITTAVRIANQTRRTVPVRIATSFQNSLYSRMRITWKTVHDINKMEDNFALRYVFTYPGIISRAELVPSHGASRRRLGDKLRYLWQENGFKRISRQGFSQQSGYFLQYLFEVNASEF